MDRLVARGSTQAVDKRLIKALRLPSGAPRMGMAWAPVMRGITQLGGPAGRYSIALSAAFILCWSGYPTSAVWLIVTLGSGWIVDGLLKHLFRIKRPTIVPHLAHAGAQAAPAAHAQRSADWRCSDCLRVGRAAARKLKS
ncbi:MAG: hypothetical protein ABIS09_08840 [Sphingomicrobium sp.]